MSNKVHVPLYVRIVNPILLPLLRLGLRRRPMALLTVRGRRSGRPRATPVGLLEVDGHRYLFSAFGEVDWVRNLRAAGEGALTRGRRQQPVDAVELRGDEAVTFYQDILAPYLRRQRFSKTMAGMLGLGDVLDDPAGAAARHPVFELRPKRQQAG